HRKSHRDGIDSGLGLDRPEFLAGVGGISGKLTSSLPLKNEIAGGRKNATIDGNLFFDGPARCFCNGIPGDEAAEEARATFTGFDRRFGIGAAVRRWNVDETGQRVVTHGPPVVDGPLAAAALRSGYENGL